MSIEPLKITWELVFPAVLGDMPIHLDGLLAWAAADAAGDDGVPWWEVIDKLPLAKAVRGEHWVWKASTVSFQKDTPPSTLIYRRSVDFEAARNTERDTGGLNMKRSSLRKAGQYKSWQLQAPLTQVSSAQAWCMGVKSEIESLLDRVTHLGKLARLGYGHISGFHVEVDSDAETRWQQRTLPWPREGYAMVLGNSKPPYWRRDQRIQCWMPLEQ